MKYVALVGIVGNEDGEIVIPAHGAVVCSELRDGGKELLVRTDGAVETVACTVGTRYVSAMEACAVVKLVKEVGGKVSRMR